jgi:hypothetical protein
MSYVQNISTYGTHSATVASHEGHINSGLFPILLTKIIAIERRTSGSGISDYISNTFSSELLHAARAIRVDSWSRLSWSIK